jgi:hypothetical protein
MPGGHLFVGQVVILAVACGLYSPSCLEEAFSEIQRSKEHEKGAEVVPRPLLY